MLAVDQTALAQFRSMQARPSPLRRPAILNTCGPHHVLKIAPLAAWLVFETTRVSAPHTLAAGCSLFLTLFLRTRRVRSR